MIVGLSVVAGLLLAGFAVSKGEEGRETRRAEAVLIVVCERSGPFSGLPIQANAAQQVLEPRVGAQGVEAGP